MKWLRFAGQYINTGIAPGAGFRVVTNVRMTNQFSTMPIFGSRPTNAASTGSFNLWYINQFVTDHYETNFRADYGGSGSDSAFPIDFSSLPSGEKMAFTIEFGKTSKVDETSWTSPTDTVGSTRPIYIGSSNNGGTADTRKMWADIGEFVIFNASDVEVFHGMPVEQGSTEYSATPAPSNCYWDIVSQSYKTQSGGTGVIWYDDAEDDLAEEDNTTVQGADYGLKVLAEGNLDVAYMNSKYPLFGSDISIKDSQFKTYEFTLTGFNSEPSPPFPPYTYDGNFYQGSGVVERTAFTVDTGFGGKSIKTIRIQNSGVELSNFFSRAREQLYNSGTGENFNSLLNPKSKNVLPVSGISLLTIANGSTAEMQALTTYAVGGSSATYNTLGGFNGGTLQAVYFTKPGVTVQIDENGILRVKTSVPYNWIQRAFQIGGTTYRARWRDWAWYQGVKITVTVLNTPYVIE